jgi:hypothetical protein
VEVGEAVREGEFGEFVAVVIGGVPGSEALFHRPEPVVPGLARIEGFPLEVHFCHGGLQFPKLNPAQHVHFGLCSADVDAGGVDVSIIEYGRKVCVDGLVGN